jgi:hypothetical protein
MYKPLTHTAFSALFVLLGLAGCSQKTTLLPEPGQLPSATPPTLGSLPSQTPAPSQIVETESVTSQTSDAAPTPIILDVYPPDHVPDMDVALHGAGHDTLRLHEVYVFENYTADISPSQYIYREKASGLMPVSTVRGQLYYAEYEVPLAWILSMEADQEAFYRVRFNSPLQGEQTLEGRIDSWAKGGSSVELRGDDDAGVEVQQPLYLPPGQGESPLWIEFVRADQAQSDPPLEPVRQIGTCTTWEGETYPILEQALEPLTFKQGEIVQDHAWEDIEAVRFLENPWEGDGVRGFPFWTQAEIRLRDRQEIQGSIESQLGYVTGVRQDGMVVHLLLYALSECSHSP